MALILYSFINWLITSDGFPFKVKILLFVDWSFEFISFTGNISSIDEQDWIEIEFQAGETYTFNLTANNTEEDSLKNPYLKLYDSSGSLVSESNHGDSDVESIITYTSSSNGTFYILQD